MLYPLLNLPVSAPAKLDAAADPCDGGVAGAGDEPYFLVGLAL